MRKNILEWLASINAIRRKDGLHAAWQAIKVRFDRAEIVQFKIRGLIVPWRVKMVSGPDTLPLKSNEVAVVCLVRNGMPWIDVFLDHYRKLGITHFVFLDNNSSDGTAERLARESGVTLLTSQLHYRGYENSMKRYLVERFCAGHWCLFVDIDELFDFPSSRTVSLAQLIDYFEDNGFNAMVQQMVDHFADAPLAARSGPGDFRLSHRFIDTDSVSMSHYPDSPDDTIRMHSGGVRLRAFGTTNGLTKVSLFKLDGQLEPFIGGHLARGARLADVVGVLLHYPFVGDFPLKVSDAVSRRLYGMAAGPEYEAYHAVLGEGAINLANGPCRPFPGVDALAEEQFLYVGPAFRSFARDFAIRRRA